MSTDKYRIPEGAGIGHVHLKVSDIQRSLDFYCGVLGFELMQMYGNDAAFVSAGGYHHHIGLNTWLSKTNLPHLLTLPDCFMRQFFTRQERTWRNLQAPA